MHERLKVGLWLSALVLLGYLLFPGHTYLQEDSQIYVAILEHLANPRVLARDFVAVHHHLTYTIYDELALAARRLTGLDFQPILVADQLVFRFLGLVGAYLLATAFGLSRRAALLVTAAFGLGATVAGPAVLVIEYEPKPRSSAVPAVFLAMGLMAHHRYLLAGVATAVAFLYHPPSTYPFWLVTAAWCLASWKTAEPKERAAWKPWVPLGVAAAILLIAAQLQAGKNDGSTWLARIDPELEQIQRFRASYNWVSTWWQRWIWHYLGVFALSLAAHRRLRLDWHTPAGLFALGMPMVGLLSLPASWVLLERLKWALMPQFQPARALLMVLAFGILLAMACCVRAASQRKLPEAIAWGAVAYALPMTPNLWWVLIPWMSPLGFRRLLLAIGLAGLAAASLVLQRRRVSGLLWLGAFLAPYLAIPQLGKVQNYPRLHHRELDELSLWARRHTPPEAMFFFPDAGTSRIPGIFRVKAQRALYVDWKGGGQVNMIPSLARQWWARWQQVQQIPFGIDALPRYRALGIDYVVVGNNKRLAGFEPVYQNARYLVYATASPTPRTPGTPPPPR